MHGAWGFMPTCFGGTLSVFIIYFEAFPVRNNGRGARAILQLHGRSQQCNICMACALLTGKDVSPVGQTLAPGSFIV